MTNPKRDALLLIHALPKTATWEDIHNEFHIKEAKDEGLLLPDTLNVRYEVVNEDWTEDMDELF